MFTRISLTLIELINEVLNERIRFVLWWNNHIQMGIKTTLGTFDLYFVLGAGKAATANYAASEVTTIYRVQNASINEVSITFDIDGIATLGWSGNGATLREVASFDASAALRGGVDATNNFIRNRLTQLILSSSISGGAKNYLVTLTGGTITLSNNLTYLTPEVLGKVNKNESYSLWALSKVS